MDAAEKGIQSHSQQDNEQNKNAYRFEDATRCRLRSGRGGYFDRDGLDPGRTSRGFLLDKKGSATQACGGPSLAGAAFRARHLIAGDRRGITARWRRS